MRKLLFVAATIAVVVSGCAKKNNPPTAHQREAVSPDVEIVNETIDAGGITINNQYTVPVAPADLNAKPTDLLYDASGEPYRVVKKLGLNDEQ